MLPRTPAKARSTRALTATAAVVSIGALTAFVATPAAAAPGDPTEGTSQFIVATGLDLGDALLAGSYSSAPGGPAAEASTFDSAVYAGLTDTVALLTGGAAQVPLVLDPSVPAGLLSVGQGDIVGYAQSPNLLGSLAANGAVDPATGAFTEASTGGSTVNLAATFDGLGVSSATREILSQIDLQVGTVASQAVADAYAGSSGDYRLDGLSLALTSPLLTQLPGLINVALEGATMLAQEALELVAPGGVIPLPAGTIPDIPIGVGTLQLGDVTLTVTAPNFDNVVSDVMSAPGGVVVVSDDGVATVDLNTGQITIDLAPLLGGSVNGLPENTEVFTPPTMSAISAAVSNALSKTTPLFAGGVTSALHATPLGVSVDAAFVMAPNSVTPNLNNLTVATGTLTGSGSLDDFANGTSVFSSTFVQAPGLPACARPLSFGVCLAPTSVVVGGAIAGINGAVPSLAPPAIAVLAAPLMDALLDAEAVVIAEVESVVSDVYASITSAFDGLMPTLARVVINERPLIGDLGPDSYTVRAVGITLLPTFPFSSQAHLGLATSTALAFADPAVSILESEVKPSDPVTIEGAGWNPAGGDVTLTFFDEASNPVGDPVLAPVAPDGSISAVWTVPTGTPDGVLTLMALQNDISRGDTVTVHTPVVPPTPPAPPAPDLPITGASVPLLPIGIAALALLAGAATILGVRLRRH